MLENNAHVPDVTVIIPSLMRGRFIQYGRSEDINLIRRIGNQFLRARIENILGTCGEFE